MSDDHYAPWEAEDHDGGRIEPDEDGLYPWDRDAAPDDPDAPRTRSDAFTPKRRNDFLRQLAKLGCLSDAARAVGVSTSTVYRHQGQDQEFLRLCSLATRMRETPIELTAWQRAVDGVQEEVVVSGRVRTRVKYSESLLRLLLQGSNPKKYGPNPGFKRKRMLSFERKQMDREIRAEIAAETAANRMSFDDAMEALDKRLDAFGINDDRERLKLGWTKAPDGYLIPPGYAWAGGPEGPPERFNYGALWDETRSGGEAKPNEDPIGSV